MQETLVTFETAKLAKEKGFNIPCRYLFYTWLGSVSEIDNEDLETNENLENTALKEGLHKDLWIVRSTQPLLQKWLREVHKLHISFEPELDVWIIEIRKLNGINGNPLFIGYPDLEYKSYEEALEAGLQEALKLIK